MRFYAKYLSFFAALNSKLIKKQGGLPMIADRLAYSSREDWLPTFSIGVSPLGC